MLGFVHSVKIQILLSSYSGVEKKLRNSDLDGHIATKRAVCHYQAGEGSLLSGRTVPTKGAEWFAVSVDEVYQ